MDKAKIAQVAKQLLLMAVVYPAGLVGLLRAVTALDPPFLWLVGLLCWATYTVLFIRYALGVKTQ